MHTRTEKMISAAFGPTTKLPLVLATTTEATRSTPRSYSPFRRPPGDRQQSWRSARDEPHRRRPAPC
jgi:hypothetical protein